MRIGMPTTSYPSYRGDAAGAFVRTLAVALARRGHTIDIVAPSVGRDELLDDPGVRVHRVRYAPRLLERTFGRHGAPDNLAADLLAWPGALSFPLALARAIATHEPAWDAIVSHFVVPTSIVAGTFARGRPHVAIAHGTDAHVAASIPGLARRVIASASTLVCVSLALAERLAAKDAVIQAMGIDRDETRSMRCVDARRHAGLTGFAALSLSRLVPIKGIDVAIRGVARMRDIELVVAGEGPERGRLEALARSIGAPVRFVGQVEGEMRRALLAGADVFVAPSRAIGTRVEGTPTSVLEALAAGLPIVGTRVSGIADAVSHDAGLLSESSSPESIARDLEHLRSSSELRRSLSDGARRASAPYDADRVAARFEKWLQGSTSTASLGNVGASAEAGILDG